MLDVSYFACSSKAEWLFKAVDVAVNSQRMHGAATEDHGHAPALLMSRNAEHQIQPNSQADLSMPVDCQTLHKDIFRLRALTAIA